MYAICSGYARCHYVYVIGRVILALDSNYNSSVARKEFGFYNKLEGFIHYNVRHIDTCIKLTFINFHGIKQKVDDLQ